MVEVYSKKAHLINAQDPQMRIHLGKRTAQSLYGKQGKRSGVKRKEEKTSSPRKGNRTHNPHLNRQGSSPIATFTLYKDTWLQLLYEYHEGYILNSTALYPMHMKERERKCHRAEL